MIAKRNIGARYRGIRLFVWWSVGLSLTTLFFAILSWVSPWVLDRDLQLSPEQLDALATERVSQAQELKWVISHERRTELMSEAVEYLVKANELRPESEHYQWFLCITLYDCAGLETPPDRQKMSHAVSIAEQIWEDSNRSKSRTGHFLVDHSVRMGQVEEARLTLARLLEIDPNDGEAYDKLFEIEIGEGRLREALEVMNRKTKTENINPSLGDLRRLVDLNLRLGFFSEARNSLEKIILGGGGETIDWLHMGIASLASRHWKDAIPAFRVITRAFSEGESWPSAPTAGLDRYPSEFFPQTAYAVLESSLEAPTN